MLRNGFVFKNQKSLPHLAKGLVIVSGMNSVKNHSRIYRKQYQHKPADMNLHLYEFVLHYVFTV